MAQCEVAEGKVTQLVAPRPDAIQPATSRGVVLDEADAVVEAV